MSKATEQAIVFSCSGQQLLGIAHLSQEPSAEIGLIVVIGGPQYRVGSHRQFVATARAFAQAGYPVLRFDYRGMGDSNGATQGFDRVDDDIAAAIDALLRVAPSVKKILLWGLCDAASACMIYGARNDPRVCGMILANPWVRTMAGEATAKLKYYYLRRLLQRSFWSKAFRGGLELRRSIGTLFSTLRSAGKSNSDGQVGARLGFVDAMLQGVQRSRSPLLMLMSEKDLTAAEFTDLHRKSTSWRDALGDRTTFVALGGADHTFSNRKSLDDANDQALRWVRSRVTSA